MVHTGGANLKRVKFKEKKPVPKLMILIILLCIVALVAGIFLFKYLQSKTGDNIQDSVSIVEPEIVVENVDPTYILETCYDGDKEVDPRLYHYPFSKDGSYYKENKDLVTTLSDSEINRLTSKADECIQLMYGTSSSSVQSNYESLEKQMLDLFMVDYIYYDENDNETTHDTYVADYLKAISDTKYQTEVNSITDKSLVWHDGCYYVRELVQLDVKDCNDGSKLLNYFPETFESGKSYDIIVDIGFTSEIVNDYKEYVIVAIDYISSEERAEKIVNEDYLEVK